MTRTHPDHWVLTKEIYKPGYDTITKKIKRTKTDLTVDLNYSHADEWQGPSTLQRSFTLI